MKFLIIDDDDCKIKRIQEYIGENELVISKSYHNDIIKLISEKYDGLILDMCFPNFDDQPWDICKDIGLELLEELKRRKVDIPTVIFSSEYTDVSGYSNVKDYIVNNNIYIGNKVKDFIELCRKENLASTLV